MKSTVLIISSLAIMALIVTGCAWPEPDVNNNDNNNDNTNSISNTNTSNANWTVTEDGIDNWEFAGIEYKDDGLLSTTGSTALGSSTGSTSYSPQAIAFDEAEAVSMLDDSLGYSVGGAKDINAFRDDIENDYLPIPTDITYEGLFYDYYFDTGLQAECEKLFCPSYTSAVTQDPFSKDDDYYLSVGLNSGIKESDFARKKLNLVVVLDISGSMGSSFSSYYYDDPTDTAEKDPDADKSKMEIANESVVELLRHLNNDDQFGMVLFDDDAYTAKPLSLVGDTDMQAIAGHILEIEDAGGTNMSAGMTAGTALFEDLETRDDSEYENRIIFLTDAMPNTGDTTEEGLLSQLNKNANNKIYSTVIGIGVDFNTELIEEISDVTGANYYTVQSGKDFKEQMDEGFDYMVTPLVFNLKLQLDAQGFDIEQVYGSPQADAATGEIMSVKTLFPSKTEGGETKGGLVLLKLKKTSDNPTLSISTSYEDRYNNSDSATETISFTDKSPDYYDNTGIRKGIVLARYADLLKGWMIDTRKDLPDDIVYDPVISFDDGIIAPEPIPETTLGEWERTSTDLAVKQDYKDMFNTFADYFASEMAALEDDDMQQELDILNKLKEFER